MAAGDVFGFLGPNGAGKTTTLKLLMQLVFPTSGEAEILGRPAGDVNVRRRIGYLPENPYFYDHLTAEELLDYYGRLFGMDVNDNYRSWDDDLVAGSLHPIELFEYFHVLRQNNWDGVWQLDQFPFREDSVETANHAIDFLKAVDRGLDALDVEALKAAQAKHDAIGALRIAQKALFGAF